MPNKTESPRLKLPLNQRASVTPAEWCSLHGVGLTTLYKLWREGRGPEFFMLGGRRRIPADALPKQGRDAA
jgi:excisionase family DNA binding protein